MDSEYIDTAMDEAKDFWIAQTGKSLDDFDAKEAVMLYCNLSEEDVDAINEYVNQWTMHMVAHSLIDMMIAARSGNDDEGFDLGKFMGTAIAAALPVCLITMMKRSGEVRTAKRKTGDEFATTTFATAMVSMAKDDGELESIWPQQIVKDVASQCGPEEAFRIGVLCGKHG